MKNRELKVNSAQAKAISHGAGPMLVLAGPGSGKTFVITQRIINLIEEQEVSPENILVITFTKAAAKEMQERFVRATEGNFYPVNFGTFHAVFFQILKQTYQFNASSILKESDKYKYMEEILKKISQQSKDKEQSINKENIPLLLSEISKVKNQCIDLDKYESEVFKEEFNNIYEAYAEKLRITNRVDFDDMVLLCLKLLKNNPSILKSWQDRFLYILVDEFQDINPLQYEVIKLLAMNNNNLFVVGDDDQSIYRFRGSNPDIMLNFDKDFPQTQKVLLNINYRSKLGIVNTATKLIAHNKKRFSKRVEAANIANDGVKIYSFESRQLQNQNIITLIQQYMKQQESKYSDIAIIFRTNAYADSLAEKLTKAKIPFQLKEKATNIYNTVIAKDIIAYIKFALNEKDSRAFFRIMNRPVRYITRESVPINELLKEELLRNNQSKEYVIQNILQLYNQINFMKKMSPFAAVNFIRKGIGYEAYLRKMIEEQYQEKSKIEEEWTKEKEHLDELQERAAIFDTLEEWIYAIEHFDENLEIARNRAGDCIQLVTMHASKGLEWKIVIIPDLNEGVVPHKKVVTQDELEEERRMFYVALTRAKENVFLFYVQSENEKGRSGNFLPSRFIQECK